MNKPELIPHLFRTEYSKLVAVLCKTFGFEHLETAEDIASETFELALGTWPYKGIPENPVAWIYTVAKNKAKNSIQRQQLFTEKIAHSLKTVVNENTEPDIDLSDRNIADSQLQMLFAICHPAISVEAQIGLALRILCGFGIEEIANAFLTSKETINKRLYRAKEKLRTEKIRLELPSDKEVEQRLDTVLTTLYLLFSEGYYSETHDSVIREDLCLEAMRLTYLLLESELTDQPRVSALMALMCFHASRFAARRKDNYDIVLYHDQDETLWSKELIQKGVFYLHKASKGEKVSKYHIEASIAYWHTIKADTNEKWEAILQLYNRLLQIEYSPVAALNRTYALSKTRGKQEAIVQAEKLQLKDNHFYYALLGELYKGIDNEMALANLRKAQSLAKTQTDRNTIHKKINEIID